MLERLGRGRNVKEIGGSRKGSHSHRRRCLSLKDRESFQQSYEHAHQEKHRLSKFSDRTCAVQSQLYLGTLAITVDKDQPTWALDRMAK